MYHSAGIMQSSVILLGGHTASILRKSIEQESFRLHMEDATAFPLSQCAEVCARCQHKPTTAMSKYVRKQLVALGGTEPPILGDSCP